MQNRILHHVSAYLDDLNPAPRPVAPRFPALAAPVVAKSKDRAIASLMRQTETALRSALTRCKGTAPVPKVWSPHLRHPRFTTRVKFSVACRNSEQRAAVARVAQRLGASVRAVAAGNEGGTLVTGTIP